MSDQFDALRSTANHEWGTPLHIFAPLHEEFDFTVDAAASAKNALLTRYWDNESDGLKQSWDNERVWCNPPYGRGQIDFIRKANESLGLAVLLIPARTDTRVWWECIYGKAEIRFVRGRVQFVGSTMNAPFASAIVIWRGLLY